MSLPADSSIYLSTYLNVIRCTHLRIYLPIYLPGCRASWLAIYLPIYSYCLLLLLLLACFHNCRLYHYRKQYLLAASKDQPLPQPNRQPGQTTV